MQKIVEYQPIIIFDVKDGTHRVKDRTHFDLLSIMRRNDFNY